MALKVKFEGKELDFDFDKIREGPKDTETFMEDKEGKEVRWRTTSCWIWSPSQGVDVYIDKMCNGVFMVAKDKISIKPFDYYVRVDGKKFNVHMVFTA
jgi:hypothetical protein